MAANDGNEFGVAMRSGNVEVSIASCRCGGDWWSGDNGARPSVAVLTCEKCGARKSLETSEPGDWNWLLDHAGMRVERGMTLCLSGFGLKQTPTLVDLPSSRLTVTSAPSIQPSASQSQAQVSFDFGHCSCGSAGWTLVQPGIGEVVRAECPSGCGERRVVRRATANHATDAAPYHQAARDRAALSGPVQTKTVADVVRERGYPPLAEDLADFNRMAETKRKTEAMAVAVGGTRGLLSSAVFHAYGEYKRAMLKDIADIAVAVGLRLNLDAMVSKAPEVSSVVKFEAIPCDILVPIFNVGAAQACAHCKTPLNAPRLLGVEYFHWSSSGRQRCCSHECVRNLARAQRAGRHEQRKAASAERFAGVVDTLRSLESEELASLAEGRPMLFQTIRVWAGIRRHGEAGPRMVPHAARAILTERAEQRARDLRAAIRDEWDNLEDAEPVGIVPRGGVQ